MVTATKIDKSWGYELIRVNNKEQNYCSKVLHIEAGKKTSMHYHLKKHETFYVKEGYLTILTINPKTTDVESHILEPGMTMEISQGTAHQLVAPKDSSITFDETSTYSDPDDSLRVWG